jgi:hypothetical protein
VEADVEKNDQEQRLVSRRRVSDQTVQSFLEKENLVGDAYPHFPKHIEEMIPRTVDDASASMVSQITQEMRQNGYGRDDVNRALTALLPMIGPAAARSRKRMNNNIDLESLKNRLSSAKTAMDMAIFRLNDAEAREANDE